MLSRKPFGYFASMRANRLGRRPCATSVEHPVKRELEP
jgi:hypothetical protein